jgi:hypothetical protein
MRPVIFLPVIVSAVLVACAAPPRTGIVAAPPRTLVPPGAGEPAIHVEAPKIVRKETVTFRLEGAYARPSGDVEPMPVLVPDSSRVVPMPTLVPDPSFDHRMPVAGRNGGMGTCFRIRGRSSLAPAPAPVDSVAGDSVARVQP